LPWCLRGGRTGEGRQRIGGKGRRTGARQPRAPPQKPMAWLAEAQAVAPLLRQLAGSITLEVSKKWGEGRRST